MTKRSKTQAATLAACLAISLSAGIPGAYAFECESQVNQALQERGVSQNDIQSVKVVRRTGGAKSASIYDLDAWVRLNSCKNGAVVVNMTKYCMPRQVYTTGDCTVGAMPGY